MFTGLIETTGEIAEAKGTGAGLHLRVRTALAGEITPGDSIAVSGVCLTVTAVGKGEIHADIGPETLRVSTLGAFKRGQVVNLERAMRADARFGGHFVQGHVDGTGTVADIRDQVESHWLTIEFPASLSPYFVRKGSIAVDGISLTVAGLGDSQFDVMIIPFTWKHTNLQTLKAGDRVNLECDMIGKYVSRSLELSGIDLRRQGIKTH
jgi:riboflavin synthase